ncbi:MAG: manganese-transporting P-type ATPase [Thermoanaerobaculia bacterium]|jgi:cation-transporting P-type ATPase C|nr:manganese-transporting P-type ATPase [Thermoanaerobaculia bacterium]
MAADAVVMPSEVWLRSDVPGRQRWQIDSLQHDAPRVAAVERALIKVAGILSAHGNALTGRLLVLFDVSISGEWIAEAVRDALSAEPMSAEEFAAATPAARAADNSANAVLRRYARKAWISGAALAGGLVALAFGGGGPAFIAITGTAALISGWGYFRGTFAAMRKRQLTTDTLVATATVASIILGETLSALTVIFLLSIGAYLELLTIQRTRRAIRDLLSVDDAEVWLVVGEDVETRRPIAEIHAGDLIAVYAGEKIAVDGVIESGDATINEAPITGESMPVERCTGGRVWAGTLLMAGQARVRVTGVGAETAIGRLIRRVEEAQELKPHIQTIGERFATKFVPGSFLLAGLVLVFTGVPAQALTMLLIACPCAAGLASPTAVSAAIGNAARRGILIKGGTHLEAAAQVDVIVFDKTGTLTEGTPSVQRILPYDAFLSEEQVLAIAAGAEVHAQHPMALAILGAAQSRALDVPPHDVCETIAGRGVRAEGSNGVTLVGSRRLLEEHGVLVPELAELAERHHAENGETVVSVAFRGALIGQIAVSDRIRPEAANALARLRAAGVPNLVMLTGDSPEVAAAVARAVGLSDWSARLLPEEKFDRIRQLRAEGHRVAMVGDGVNDAPALALADVGIAMGTAGSDVAIEAADVALAADNLEHVASMIEMSRRTIHLIRQNYGMALGVNSVGIVAGAFGSLNPMLAAVFHNLSTILVVLNSTRLIRFDPDAAANGRGVPGRVFTMEPADEMSHVCVDAACCAVSQ